MALVFRSKSEFNLLRQLRSGGFGSVAVVRHQVDFAEYVLKEVNLSKIERDLGGAAEMAARLIAMTRSEYAKIKQFNHPNIVRVFGSFEETRQNNDRFQFIVMEFCRGGDLEMVIDEARRNSSQPIAEWQIQAWTRQLMSAMHFLHSNGNVHRDIKPGNVFLDASKQIAKLGDFGLTKEIELVTQKTIVATWHYAAPEMCRNEAYTPKCDIWSLGVLVYELANLKRPFPGDGPAVVASILMTQPSAFTEAEHYSTDLRQFVAKMLEKKPSKRPEISDLFNSPFMQSDIMTSRQFGRFTRSLSSPMILLDVASVRTSLLSTSTESTNQFEVSEVSSIGSPTTLQHLDWIRQSAVISPTMKEAICAKLQLELLSAEDLAELDEEDVTLLFPDQDTQMAVIRWQNEFEQKMPDRLLFAAEKGDLNVLQHILSTEEGHQLLLPNSDDIWTNLPDSLNDGNTKPSGDRPLHRACRFGQLAAVRRLVEESSTLLNQPNNRGGTPVFIATDKGHLDVVEFLLKRQPDLLESRDQFGDTLLNRAVLFGHLSIVQLLAVNLKMDLETKGHLGCTPLLQACLAGHLAVVEWLLMNGANIKAKSNQEDNEAMAIHLAAGCNHRDIVALLLEIKPNLLEAVDKMRQTPLSRAAFGGNLEMVKFLVGTKKANVGAKDSLGRTPLMAAAQEGFLDVVEWLVEDDEASMDATSENGSDDGEWLAIHLAAYFGRKEVFSYLLGKGGRFLEAKTAANNTPLNLAAANGQLATVKLLAGEMAANVENRGELGRTPLLMAVANGHLSIVELCLELGANLEADDSTDYHDKSIHLAAFYGYLEIVHCIISRKPDLLEQRNAVGQTPLFLAEQENKTEVADFLRSKGAEFY